MFVINSQVLHSLSESRWSYFAVCDATVCQYLINSKQPNKGLFGHEELEQKNKETSKALTVKVLEGYRRF